MDTVGRSCQDCRTIWRTTFTVARGCTGQRTFLDARAYWDQITLAISSEGAPTIILVEVVATAIDSKHKFIKNILHFVYHANFIYIVCSVGNVPY